MTFAGCMHTLHLHHPRIIFPVFLFELCSYCCFSLSHELLVNSCIRPCYSLLDCCPPRFQNISHDVRRGILAIGSQFSPGHCANNTDDRGRLHDKTSLASPTNEIPTPLASVRQNTSSHAANRRCGDIFLLFCCCANANTRLFSPSAK